MVFGVGEKLWRNEVISGHKHWPGSLHPSDGSETCPMSNNQPKTFCPLLQPLQSENKTHPLPSPGVKKVWIPSQMLDLQDVPKRECIGAGGGGGGVECHTPLAPAELRVAPSRLTLSRPRHTGKDPPLIKVTTDHHIIRGHI